VPVIAFGPGVRAGDDACATLSVTNDDSSASDVSLYCTNLIADSGHEIPSVCVTVSPRVATINANSERPFRINVAVSPQTPAGTYSGLVQAMGNKYTRAVLSVEVL